jgi:hypothetical protein
MNLKESGTSLGLETFKESVQKKHKKDKAYWYVKFLLVFFISHMLRSILEPTPLEEVKQEELRKGYLRIKLNAESFVSSEENKVNLFHKSKHLEISNVIIISRDLNRYELDIKSNNISKILLNQEGWQLIPLRPIVINKKKRSHEILL